MRVSRWQPLRPTRVAIKWASSIALGILLLLYVVTALLIHSTPILPREEAAATVGIRTGRRTWHDAVGQPATQSRLPPASGESMTPVISPAGIDERVNGNPSDRHASSSRDVLDGDEELPSILSVAWRRMQSVASELVEDGDGSWLPNPDDLLTQTTCYQQADETETCVFDNVFCFDGSNAVVAVPFLPPPDLELLRQRLEAANVATAAHPPAVDAIAISAALTEQRLSQASLVSQDNLGALHGADHNAQCYDYRYYEATLQVCVCEGGGKLASVCCTRATLPPHSGVLALSV